MIQFAYDTMINEITLPGVYVVGDEIGNDVVLGRNALNKLMVTLDGPRELVGVEI